MQKKKSFKELCVWFVILLIPLFIFDYEMAWCFTKPGEARETLESYRYSNIKIVGWAQFGCGTNQFYHTRFTALNEYSEPVSGVVCSQRGYGSTISYDDINWVDK